MPGHFSTAYEPALFNTPDFHRLHDTDTSAWLWFHVLDSERKTAQASLCFHVKNGVASSPLRAPFGSVEACGDISPRVLHDFLGFVEDGLKTHGVREVLIKSPPRAYSEELIALWETFLLNRGFTVSAAEVGTVLPVTDIPFTTHVAHAQALRRNQAKSAGLSFQLLPSGTMEQVYPFIASCHREKGYHLSITGEQLCQASGRFPERYILSAVFDNDHMCAAAVSVRVKQDILYNFLVNHEKRFNTLSPPVLLMEGLYDYCRENGIRMLDLGTSALEGEPNFSLLDFKMRMGGKPTSKLSFHKIIG